MYHYITFFQFWFSFRKLLHDKSFCCVFANCSVFRHHQVNATVYKCSFELQTILRFIWAHIYNNYSGGWQYWYSSILHIKLLNIKILKIFEIWRIDIWLEQFWGESLLSRICLKQKCNSIFAVVTCWVRNMAMYDAWKYGIIQIHDVRHKLWWKTMNTLESFRIYEAYKQGIQLNEAAIETCNPIYEIIIKNQTNRSLYVWNSISWIFP
jgi:hypothetical protein